jgi:hypothetical protein
MALVVRRGETKAYEFGKDTVESFGDGTRQIVRTGGGPSRRRHLSRWGALKARAEGLRTGRFVG